jgi:hypothetical protein
MPRTVAPRATFRAEGECPTPEHPLKADDNAADAKNGSLGHKLTIALAREVDGASRDDGT